MKSDDGKESPITLLYFQTYRGKQIKPVAFVIKESGETFLFNVQFQNYEWSAME